MGVPCTSHMEKRVIPLAMRFPFRHSMNTPKPSAVPESRDITVISSVFVMPSRKRLHRFSLIKVLSKLLFIPDQKVDSWFPVFDRTTKTTPPE